MLLNNQVFAKISFELQNNLINTKIIQKNIKCKKERNYLKIPSKTIS